MPLTQLLFLDSLLFVTMIAQLDIPMEFDCRINALFGPGKVHSSDKCVNMIVDILHLSFSDLYSNLLAPCYPLFFYSSPLHDLHL